MFRLYLVTNIINGKKFVGYSEIEIVDEFHILMDKAYALRGAVRKFGKDCFRKKCIFLSWNFDEIKEKEREYIKRYNTFAKSGWGYNITKGGFPRKTRPSFKVKKSWDIEKQQLPLLKGKINRKKVKEATKGYKNSPWAINVKRKFNYDYRHKGGLQT